MAVTVGVSVTCHHAPFDHTEVPFPPPKVPPPCPALVLPRLQVNCFQIGGLWIQCPVSPEALLSNTRGCSLAPPGV